MVQEFLYKKIGKGLGDMKITKAVIPAAGLGTSYKKIFRGN